MPSRPKSSAARNRFPQELSFDVTVEEIDRPLVLEKRVARMLRIPEEALPKVVLKKRSIDARRGRVNFHCLVEVGGDDLGELRTVLPRMALAKEAGNKSGGPKVVIVGDGPAGLFCAYELMRQGIAPLILDRGKEVQPRRHDLKGLQKRGVVDEDSNYCFGEGGAGTYSDGKLYTRAHKRGDIRDVLETLVLHGAPSEILVDARPHIGSNRLPKLISSIRERLIACGAEFRFGAKVVDFRLRSKDSHSQVQSVVLASGEEIEAQHVVLATGHSARDIYRWFALGGHAIEFKSFAAGVRIEHPQSLVNRIQYGSYADHPRLPNASYRLVQQVEDRGVFSFCMCPGGWIVPASTEADGLVVNGMSLSRRDSPYANSGFVVSIEEHDLLQLGFSKFAKRGALMGMHFQEELEKAAALAGGGALKAPATRASDFLERRASSDAPSSSYLPGLNATDLRDVLDCTGFRLSERLREALAVFANKMPGYGSSDGVLVGVETRTSSPVRIPRNPESLAHVEIENLYPTAEGAGYAGGIVSAALDGMRVARSILTDPRLA